MTYVIITERSKTNRPDLWADIYYSHIYGCFSPRDKASLFASFEEAQPKVRELRDSGVPFVHAIEASRL